MTLFDSSLSHFQPLHGSLFTVSYDIFDLNNDGKVTRAEALRLASATSQVLNAHGLRKADYGDPEKAINSVYLKRAESLSFGHGGTPEIARRKFIGRQDPYVSKLFTTFVSQSLTISFLKRSDTFSRRMRKRRTRAVRVSGGETKNREHSFTTMNSRRPSLSNARFTNQTS